MKLDCEKEKTAVKYGLRVKKTDKLVKFSSESNDGKDFCGDTTVRLNEYGDQEWLVDDAYIAEYVRNFSTEWYNAGYETPRHGYEPEELEVMQVTIITRSRPLIVKIPTAKQYYELKYGEGSKRPDAGHLKYVLSEIKERPGSINYSLYELRELMLEGPIK